MVFVPSILFAAYVLPSVMGLTLNTPATTDEDGTLEVTWTTAEGDPTFALLLDGPISIDIATGVVPSTLKTSVGLGQIPPGTYTLEAVQGDDIEKSLSKSQPFTIAPIGDPSGAPAAAPPAAAPPAASSAAPPPPAAAPPPPPPASSAPLTSNSNGGPPFDPAGVPNVGNGVGKQFIGGQCLSNADCASACCAGPSGICSGPGAQLEAGKTGCGFTSGAAPAASAPAAAPPAAESPAAAPPAASAPLTSNSLGGPPFDPAGVPNVGNGVGKQFIGGQCLSAADCNSGCCAGPSGICSGVGAQTQAGKTGCGFVSKRFVSRSRSMLVL